MNQPVLYELDFRLSYGECDPAGIVYFASYYPWFERVFNEWCFVNGFATEKMRELWGASHVSRASNCEYLIPGRLHDPLTCRMLLGHVGETSYSMRFEVVHREDGQIFATGGMFFVFVDEQFPPRPVTVPEGLRAELRTRGYDV
ncbi:MAG: acyl-CoA thioesterase [Nostocoides sp.]